MRYTDHAPRTTRYARAPRRASNPQELREIYRRYIRMGFEPSEARFKANLHHGMKL